VDTLVLTQKLESLRRCLRRIEEKCPPQSDMLASDPDLQDIVVLNLTRAVQLCVDIASHIISGSNEISPVTMGDAFATLEKLGVLDAATTLSLRKAVGFRNVAVHNYESINWEIVYNICRRQLQDFRQFARCVTTYCQI
jgi:uncharacterized protein YutE (UPF0331/DUF86 family)